MVRVNCQNGDGGGSWVGEFSLSPNFLFKAGKCGCGFVAYSWKLPTYSGAFLLTIDTFSFFAYSWSFSAYNCSFFTYNSSFLAYNGRVRLIRALRDCKQRSSTVSKKAPTVSKKLPPKRKRIPVPVPPLFLKGVQWGKRWPVPMNLPFLAVEAYVPAGGPESGHSKNAFRPIPVKKSFFQFCIFGHLKSSLPGALYR